ncbi:unnamed protein product [Psylliodes chrysocephalus]|uniref:Uncharacterized protein n=1 Tax=Psylliodes chrysocephalus TaxID=3402493 RepID=A0A9P0CPG5_9CUCU|nr:unnamed protein product [Psylliodes chrysocephala]
MTFLSSYYRLYPVILHNLLQHLYKCLEDKLNIYIFHIHLTWEHFSIFIENENTEKFKFSTCPPNFFITVHFRKIID